MKLVSPTRQRIVLAPIRPSAGEEAWYRSRLQDLCADMRAHTMRKMVDLYPAHPMGAVPQQMQHTLTALETYWTEVFASRAHELATQFAWGVVRHHDQALATELRKHGFQVEKPQTVVLDSAFTEAAKKSFGVKFSADEAMQAKIRARVADNVDLIKKIPKSYHEKIRKATEESVLAGREIREYTDTLEKLGAEDLRHAALIARDQNNKITGYIHQLRQQELGIEKALWTHTTYTPNPREEHLDFDGEEYPVDEGHDFEDGFGPVQPGEAINCGCLSRSIIPGYNDNDEEGGEGEQEG
jgi:uncharacterized protein with gpF-like domain